MILGIGIDIVSVIRIEKLLQDFDQKFVNKIFTENEIKKANEILENKRAVFFAKRFSAKEAFSKALGIGIGRGVDFLDIEVENDQLGKPSIRILNNKEDFIRQHFNVKSFSTHLSLSDEKDLATAKVIIETN